MCIVLGVSRNTYYFKINQQENHEKRAAVADLQERIFKVFQQSRNNYGTRKIKRELEK